MQFQQLSNFKATDYLAEGHAEVLNQLKPFFTQLIDTLIALPDDASNDQLLHAFERCIQHINDYEDEIETIERETLLGAIYDIGSIVGLDPTSRFAERWRGDW